jgi:hypothetical protein
VDLVVRQHNARVLNAGPLDRELVANRILANHEAYCTLSEAKFAEAKGHSRGAPIAWIPAITAHGSETVSVRTKPNSILQPGWTTFA